MKEQIIDKIVWPCGVAFVATLAVGVAERDGWEATVLAAVVWFCFFKLMDMWRSRGVVALSPQETANWLRDKYGVTAVRKP